MIPICLAFNLLLMATSCLSISLPEEINKCHFGAEKCIIDSMNHVIKKYPKGIPKIGLKPIDVVDIRDSILIETDQSGPIWMSLNLTKQIIYGFENTTITEVEGFEKDPTAQHLTISGRIPSLIHKGHYCARRHILLITMDLKGESTSDFQNLRFTLKLKGTIEFRNNKRYLKIYELVPNVKIDRWILWMQDLFEENTDLTNLVNRLFNIRWLEVWNELEAKILEIFSGLFLGMIKETFENNSYDDMFLPDLTETQENAL
ncbi:uncharacterized protein LOC117571730 [Drosophila albomicans]|uniref:Uncharacterized protein LOC117571730 n=1 Tax=Drosophila albomicans TaxID=7291 RepID=A0A6P8YXP5_DROAB|nr:uncharacterized protein LOC117571730 [Drosophila albomicans]